MALGSAKAPFSHPDWLFELKYDGFRALAHIDGKRTQLVSRNGHPFASFSDLGHAIAAALPYTQRAVLDGEIVCLDRKGRPQFEDLLRVVINLTFRIQRAGSRQGHSGTMSRIGSSSSAK